MRRHDARVLLVEANVSSGAALRHGLRGLGCRLIDAVPEAVQAIEHLNEHRYDLVFCSDALPSGSGLQLIRWIRQSPRLEALPVVVVAAVTPQLVLEAAEAGVSAFLPQPFRLGPLEELLRIFIGRRTDASSAVAAPFLS